MGSVYITFCESFHLQLIVFTLFMDFLPFIYRTVERDSKVEGKRGEMGRGSIHVDIIWFIMCVFINTMNHY